MNPLRSILAVVAALALNDASAAEGAISVTVTHDLATARPAETITIPWATLAKALPGALLQHLAVTDAAGRTLPYQVTNVAPESKDPKGSALPTAT
jgi:hypothetical protein